MKNLEILPAVSGVIFNDRGDVLLQRRIDTGKWCIISGHVEFGESIEEAMMREIQEEIGVSSLPHDLGLVNPNWLADALNSQPFAFIR